MGFRSKAKPDTFSLVIMGRLEVFLQRGAIANQILPMHHTVGFVIF